jgi:very-short-patch-repair endonuclease
MICKNCQSEILNTNKMFCCKRCAGQWKIRKIVKSNLHKRKLPTYPSVEIACKQCQSLFIISSAPSQLKKFCSMTCSAKYNNHARAPLSKESKEKQAAKLRLPEKYCEWCNIKFKPKRSRNRFCGRSCSARHVSSRPEIKAQYSERMKSSSHKGWKKRGNPSFAEKFWMDQLKEYAYQFEYVIKKSDIGLDEIGNYFLDFYFPALKINLEIDGKQHKQEDRKQSDQKRDNALIG